MRPSLALAVVPLLMAWGASSARPASADAPVAPFAPVAPVAPDDAAPLPSEDTRWYATLAPALDVGGMPLASPGLSAGLDVRRGALAASVIASGFLAQVDRASNASIALFDLMTTICALGPIGTTFDVGACGGPGVGMLRGAGRGLRSAESASAVRPEGVAFARFDVRLGPTVVLSATAGTIVDPVRSPLRLGGAADDFRPSLFGFRAALGIHVRFW